MRTFAAFAILSSTVGFAAAGVERRWAYPESYIAARQWGGGEGDPEPGTPRYLCHENCGTAITLGREEDDHCTHDEWNQRYNSCLECANTFEIWRYYGTSVTAYAEECGLTPVPSPSGFEPEPEETTTPPAPQPTEDDDDEDTTTAPPAPQPTEDDEDEEEDTTTAPPAPQPTESAPESVADESTTLYPVPSPTVSSASVPSASGNGTAPPEPTFSEAAAGSVAASFAMVGAAAALALAL